MVKRARLALNNQVVALVGLFGIGLLPCPDCGLPLAIKIWPVAGIVWVLRRVRRRSLHKLDLLLTEDLLARHDDLHRAGQHAGGDLGAHLD